MTAGAVIVPTIMPLRAPIPGQHKTTIDSNTKIELRSGTDRAIIFYTINGDKPSPFEKLGPRAENTFRYREPFKLQGGRRTVKAVAVSSDGIRESHVVTKVFDVEKLDNDRPEPGDNAFNFVNDIPANEFAKKEVNKFAHKMVTSKQAFQELEKMKQTEQMMTEMALHGSNKRKTYPEARHLNNRLGNLSDRATIGNDVSHMNGDIDAQMIRSRRMPPDTATQTMRLQRETDFLKCVYCFSPRPSDPYARFCNECGNPVPPLPQSRMPPPEAGQMGTCVGCKTLVPFNTSSCLVCETPIQAQNTPQASIRLADKTVCVACGTANPINVSSCLACEASLPIKARPVNHGMSAAPVPRDDGRLVACTKCNRVNNPDARYCDWCGSKPSPVMSSLTCSQCSASNQPYAKHCASCSVFLDAPHRNDPRNGGVALNLSSPGPNSMWNPVTLPKSPVAKYDTATQTVGLFFPSQKEISRKQQDEDDKIAQEMKMRDRNPPLTAISPGRGYWRKQMDHVTAHIKAYAQNNPEFRALIGEPRMGKLISATVHEDGHELSLTMNFTLKGSTDPFVGGRQMGVTKELMSSYTNGRLRSYGSEDSLVSGNSTARSKTRKRSARRAKKKQTENKQKPEDRDLLREVGKNGDGNAEEILRLVDEDQADPNCKNKDGVPALHVAAMNRQLDALDALVEAGADINQKGPNKGNTALHEVISLGSGGLEVIDKLISLGASTKKKNDKDETPYDLSVKGGYDTVTNKLTASYAQNALGKMTKPKSSRIEDEF